VAFDAAWPARQDGIGRLRLAGRVASIDDESANHSVRGQVIAGRLFWKPILHMISPVFA